MNEAICQNEIYVHASRLNHRYIVPNVTLFGWESDMVSVTGAGYRHISTTWRRKAFCG